jgi:anti-sigma factor RsiW
MTAMSHTCPEREPLLHGLSDNELDAANAFAVEAHVQSCPRCAEVYDDILRQKQLLKSDGLRFRAPESFRARVQVMIAAQEGAEAKVAPSKFAYAPAKVTQMTPRRSRLGRAGTAFSALALAASLILFVGNWNQAPGLDDQLVAAHVRSLLVSHLTDVASSDQHTVKPWFLGKLDFAPPVIDLAQMGYPLQGGRLDYIGGRVVPALVYKRHGHVINLFVWPIGEMEGAPKTLGGYHIISWIRGGFAYAAVSDLNLPELQEFHRDLEEALSSS